MVLIAFDFDGTLSTSEMTVLLGEQKGVDEKINNITERAMNNEIGYAESLRKRVSLLEGLSESKVKDAFDKITLRKNTAGLLRSLKESNVHIAIITGGFERGVKAILEKKNIDIDTLIANRLVLKNGRLTGKVEGPLIEGTKDDMLKDIIKREKIDIPQTIAVGDGANDLPMLKISGYSIGYQPKPAVEPHCDTVVNTMEELKKKLIEKEIIKKTQ